MTNDAPDLPTHVEKTVQSIGELHAQHVRRASKVHKIVQRLTSTAAKPRFLGLLIVFIALWVGSNLLLVHAGRQAFDPAPFSYLGELASIISVFLTVLILITQSRDDELIEAREQLTLELAILSEQKSAKIIELIEELRRDHAQIADRKDAEAEALAVPADPEAVLDALKTQQPAR